MKPDYVVQEADGKPYKAWELLSRDKQVYKGVFTLRDVEVRRNDLKTTGCRTEL